MDEKTRTKVIIAGSVGGASMLSVTILVLAVLLCRHRMKETRRKKKLLQREEIPVVIPSSSESSSPQETTGEPTPLPSSSDTGSSFYPSDPTADLSGSYTPRTGRSVIANSCIQADSPDPATPTDSTLSYNFQPVWTSAHSSQDYSRVYHSLNGPLQRERVSRELSITIYPAYPSSDYVELDAGQESRQIEVLNGGDAYAVLDHTGKMKSSVT